MHLHRICAALLAMTITMAADAQAGAAAVSLYAAGSLREALTDVASRFEAQGGARVALTFGASGLLRERIEQGEPAEVFASADTEHPRRLARSGKWQEPVVFARNLMCALAAPGIEVTAATLLATMLRPDIRLGTSTPRADPSGDYAWALFRRADAVRPGALATLDAKAMKLTGGPESAQPPAGRNTYAWLMDEGKADIFLTYCTGAVAVKRELPRMQVIEVPPELQVAASYGLTVRHTAGPEARLLALFILSPPAQAVLRSFGFGAPEAP